MEARFIQHRPRHIHHVHVQFPEGVRDIMTAPHESPDAVMACPDCECRMMYRGIGRLRNGQRVYVYECVHSHREVYSVSVVISQD